MYFWQLHTSYIRIKLIELLHHYYFWYLLFLIPVFMFCVFQGPATEQDLPTVDISSWKVMNILRGGGDLRMLTRNELKSEATVSHHAPQTPQKPVNLLPEIVCYFIFTS